MLYLNIWFSTSLVLPIKSYEPENICPIFENREKHPLKSDRILTKITSSDLAYQRTLQKKFQALIYENVEFCIFLPHVRSRMRVYYCFFSRGHGIDPVVLECRERAQFDGNEKFYYPF